MFLVNVWMFICMVIKFIRLSLHLAAHKIFGQRMLSSNKIRLLRSPLAFSVNTTEQTPYVTKYLHGISGTAMRLVYA